jgi:16S rRNA G966 N2-methylase RsmD
MPVRPRRALSHARGAITQRGEAAALARALEMQNEDPDTLTHGFHSYPARMHPALVRAVIAAHAGARVLDPFCGSGTVLVEAMVAGRQATGVDLSPLALRVAEAHTALRDEPERTRLLATSREVVEASLARVRARVPARAPLAARERALYAPHVLIELAGLLEELRKVPIEADRRALEIVFSSLLVKLSSKRADTSDEQVDKRLRKGLPSELFGRKCEELCARWAALYAAVRQEGRPSPVPPRLLLGDARALSERLGDERFDLVLSSPPYGGTYDYYVQHALRYAWLGLDASRLREHEVGARRRLSHGHDAAEIWERELRACLRSIASVTESGAKVVVLLGDALLAGGLVDAGEQLERLAPQSGLAFLAAASQLRPDFARGPGPRRSARREHLVLLERRRTGRTGG